MDKQLQRCHYTCNCKKEETNKRMISKLEFVLIAHSANEHQLHSFNRSIQIATFECIAAIENKMRKLETLLPGGAEHQEARKGQFNEIKTTTEAQENNKDTQKGKPQLDDKGFVDSGCSRHMTGLGTFDGKLSENDGSSFVGDILESKAFRVPVLMTADTVQSIERKQFKLRLDANLRKIFSYLDSPTKCLQMIAVLKMLILKQCMKELLQYKTSTSFDIGGSPNGKKPIGTQNGFLQLTRKMKKCWHKDTRQEEVIDKETKEKCLLYMEPQLEEEFYKCLNHQDFNVHITRPSRQSFTQVVKGTFNEFIQAPENGNEKSLANYLLSNEVYVEDNLSFAQHNKDLYKDGDAEDVEYISYSL
ncbi:hypothetical protein Tco_0895003 [Tanacetum coccineum]|uniref:Uncharacterized protein n=1 Tax=Tanacetum coccineum TaxID=301880 RepID=A0ABQ5CGP1_9ASTR